MKRMARCKNEHTYVSHPVRVRGLKQIPAEPASDDEGVAPREGAWIETNDAIRIYPIGPQSHPVRVRGLKLLGPRQSYSRIGVAPREGAWIETPKRRHSLSNTFVAPREGAWIETF